MVSILIGKCWRERKEKKMKRNFNFGRIKSEREEDRKMKGKLEMGAIMTLIDILIGN